MVDELGLAGRKGVEKVVESTSQCDAELRFSDSRSHNVCKLALFAR